MILVNYRPDDPSSLTLDEANSIWSFKRGSTWRALSIQFLGEENQLDGRDLARDAACRILGVTLEQLFSIEWGKDPDFDELHSSDFGGDAYWWE